MTALQEQHPSLQTAASSIGPGPKPRTPKLADCKHEDSAVDVDAAQLEELVESMNLGQKIQMLRLERSLTLVELGKLCRLSASYLSQLEKGKVCPTVRNLARLAIVFDEDLSYFFRQEEGLSFRISRVKDRINLALGLRDVPVLTTEDMSGLVPSRSLIPYITEIAPGSHGSSFDPEQFYGTEFVYLLSGSSSVVTAKQSRILEPRDVLWIDGNTSRRYACIGHTPARLLVMSFVQRVTTGKDRCENPAKARTRIANR